jgi:sulfate-transporting ATPase
MAEHKDSAVVLSCTGLSAGYAEQAAVRDVTIELRRGEIVALLGPNGAGKTTTVLALAGAIPLMSGEVRLNGEELTGPLHVRARQKMTLITQERSTIMGLSVADNLKLGGVTEEEVYTVFPELASHSARMAGLLSGGQQQMLTLGRALCRKPDVLLVDELSLGLAPIIVDRLLGALHTAADAGAAVLIVEQHVEKALGVSDRAYVLGQGQIRMEGSSKQFIENSAEIKQIYLGANPDAAPAAS